jgi:hypothetical protein
VRVSVLSTFAVCFLLSAVASGHAQVSASPPPSSPLALPPTPGFVPPYEITRTVRKAGFDPLAPPLREGTTYVLRATDYRGILMRVVVDARTGAIRDVNRIVPGPGSYGPYGPYGPAPYGRIGMVPYDEPPDAALPPYGPPPEFDGLAPAGSGLPQSSPHLSVVHPSRAGVTVLPPLPRPRPAELASRKPAEHAKSEVTPSTAADARAETQPETKTDVKPTPKRDAQPETGPAGATPGAAAAATAASAPAASAASAPPTTAVVKVPPPPPIND